MNWQLFEASANVHFKRMLVIFLVSWVAVQFAMLWYFGFEYHRIGRRVSTAAIPALIPCAVYLVLMWIWNNYFAPKQTQSDNT